MKYKVSWFTIETSTLKEKWFFMYFDNIDSAILNLKQQHSIFDKVKLETE